MRKDWSSELERLNYRCGVCAFTWDGKPDLTEPDEGAPHHPWRYFADCPGCGAKLQPQAAWERALLKAHQHSTGPKSAAGKAATAANLVGHPTPEEALRTRFNAMKHGLNAKVATYFPARPDGYAFCARCEVDRYWCGEQPACVKQTEIFMLHHAAFEQRDPKILARLHGELHAALVATLQMCLQAVIADGVVLKTPKVQLDANGRAVTLTFIDEKGDLRNVMEYASNPALKPLTDLVSRLGLDVSSLGMSVRTVEDEDDALRGRLAGTAVAQEALAGFTDRMAAALEKLPGRMAAARERAEADPVLVEHRAAQGGTPPAADPGAGGRA